MTRKWRQRWAAPGVVLVAVVLLSSCGSGEKPAAAKKAPLTRPWVCEACSHKFLARPVPGVRQCPSCGKQAAIRSIVYTCGRCDKRFEAYRFLDCTGMEAPKDPAGKAIEPGLYLKKKGGGWVGDEEMLGELKCPHCGNADRAKMQIRAGPAP